MYFIKGIKMFKFLLSMADNVGYQPNIPPTLDKKTSVQLNSSLSSILIGEMKPTHITQLQGKS